MAKRFCDWLGDRDNPENELFPHLKLVAGIHPTKRLAGFERFFEMRHTVPERQGHMAKVADVRWLSLNEKCIAMRVRKYLPSRFSTTAKAGRLSSTMRVAPKSVPAARAISSAP